MKSQDKADISLDFKARTPIVPKEINTYTKRAFIGNWENPLKDKELEYEMEEAIHYLTTKVLECGLIKEQGKPVIIHSISVGTRLYMDGYGKTTVIAGILHDLIEDTHTTYDDIIKDFGKDVANLVQACSFDSGIEDKYQQAIDMYKHCKEHSKEALLIKCTDMLTNAPYFFWPSDKSPSEKALKNRRIFVDKYEAFLKDYALEIKDEPVYKDLYSFWQTQLLPNRNNTAAKLNVK